MIKIAVGEIRFVTHHGWMRVAEIDFEKEAARMLWHGPADKQGLWVYFTQIGDVATAEDLRRAHREAATNQRDCNSPGCWCIRARMG